MNTSEALMTRLENQISAMFDTILELEKVERAEPARKLSNWHETALGMVFMGQVLTKNCFYTKIKGLSQEQAMEYIQQAGEATHEHLLSLYGYDARKEI